MSSHRAYIFPFEILWEIIISWHWKICFPQRKDDWNSMKSKQNQNFLSTSPMFSLCLRRVSVSKFEYLSLKKGMFEPLENEQYKKKTCHLSLKCYMSNCNGVGIGVDLSSFILQYLVNFYFSWVAYINTQWLAHKKVVWSRVSNFGGCWRSHISLGYHHRSGKRSKEISTFICSFSFPGQIIMNHPYLFINLVSATVLKGQGENCSRRDITVSCILTQVTQENCWHPPDWQLPTQGITSLHHALINQVLSGARS